MNKAFYALLAAVSATGLSAPAAATDFITIQGSSGVYGNPSITCAPASNAPCNFTSTFTFATPVGFNLVSASVSSVLTGSNASTNIDFTSVTLNGVNFAILSTGVQEFRNLLNQNMVSGGFNTISVNGTSGGNAAFSGNLSFAGAAAVPEPAVWAMMILGFGVVGGAMRGLSAMRKGNRQLATA